MTIALETKELTTLFWMSDFGFGIRSIACREIKVEIVKYAQYDDAVKITYLQKGKRKHRVMLKGYRPWFVVVKGHEINQIKPDMEPLNDEMSMSRHTSFDESWKIEADAYIAALSNEILFKVQK